MPVEAYSRNDPRSRLADWVEVSALVSSAHSQSREQFLRATSALEEPVFDEDDEDLGGDWDDENDGDGSRYILDDRQQNLADRVLDELEYRERTLGENYPFVIVSAGTSWKLVYRPAPQGSARVANYAYCVCLLVSAVKYKYLLLDRREAEYLAIADHFQLLAYLVAPEILGGSAYWMGWPRPDSTSKLSDALQLLSERMKLGVVRQSPPAWNPSSAKDGTVDIVAWRHLAGRTPGSIVLYGQVASGSNWRGKPLHSYMDPHFTGWFEQMPARRYLHSIFIPFPLHEDCKPTKHESFERKAYEEAVRDERTYGIVVDRLRIVDLAAKRSQRSSEGSAVEQALSARLAALFRWRRFAESLAG